VEHNADDADYYAILGVMAGATLSEIHSSYRRLALRHHPDVNPPDQDDAVANQFMRRLNEAYDTLSDPVRRAAYDRRRWPPTADWQDPDGLGRQSESRRSSEGKVSQDAHAPDRSWRHRRFADLIVPDWVADLMSVEERLRERLRPFGIWAGMLVPVAVIAGLAGLGFWLYMQLRADPQSWALLTYVDRLLGGTAGFAIAGILMLLLGVGVALWHPPHR